MKKRIIFSGLILTLFLVSCTPSATECSVDKDCVPASCCHATDVVARENAPDCTRVLCTADCQSGTLDCNQGEIKCIQNKCTVAWN